MRRNRDPGVASKVARVGGGLVDIGLGRPVFPFHFQHDHSPIDQEDDVGAPRFHGEFILEDGEVFLGGSVCLEDLADLGLEFGNRVIPCTDLLGSRVPDEALQAGADDTGLGATEAGEVGIPSAAGHPPVIVDVNRHSPSSIEGKPFKTSVKHWRRFCDTAQGLSREECPFRALRAYDSRLSVTFLEWTAVFFAASEDVAVAVPGVAGNPACREGLTAWIRGRIRVQWGDTARACRGAEDGREPEG